MRATGAARDGRGVDEKARIERLCISLPYVETFNSKVIKSFVPGLRSRKFFRVSGFLCSTYICYEQSMYVSHIRIMGMLHLDSNELRLRRERKRNLAVSFLHW